MVNIDKVAAYWWTDRSTILAWIESGSLPPPTVKDGKVGWSDQELTEWERAGFPHGPRLTDAEWDALVTALLNERKDA